MIQYERQPMVDATKLGRQISDLNSSSNIVCFLLYGSVVTAGAEDINDTDIILVVKDITVDITDIFSYIRDTFKNPDIHIYAEAEINNNLAYLGREFILEYLSKGLVIYGTNIFVAKFKEVTTQQYKDSMAIRSAEYLQRIRRLYYSDQTDTNYKFNYLKKYVIRLSKSVLILNGICNHSELDALHGDAVLAIMRDNNLIKEGVTYDSLVDLEVVFQVFNQIGLLLLNNTSKDSTI